MPILSLLQRMTMDLLVGYTTDRELHPAPKVFIWLLRLYPPSQIGNRFVTTGILYLNYALTMQSTGQTLTHLGES